MRRLQKFYVATAVLSIVLGIVGCNLLDSDSDHPTLPSSSSSNLTPVGAGQVANFYVGKGVSDFYGVYIAGTSFVVNVPKPGTFLLTYYTKSGFGLTATSIEYMQEKGVPEDVLQKLTTLVNQQFATEEEYLAALTSLIGAEQLLLYEDLILRYSYANVGGPYFLVTKVKKNSLLYIGLMPGDQVLNATIDEGDATALAGTSPDAQDFGDVTVYFRPGFIGSWIDYFVINPSIPQVVLISNYAIVISTNVIALELPQGVTAKTQHYTKPKTKK